MTILNDICTALEERDFKRAEGLIDGIKEDEKISPDIDTILLLCVSNPALKWSLARKAKLTDDQILQFGLRTVITQIENGELPISAPISAEEELDIKKVKLTEKLFTKVTPPDDAQLQSDILNFVANSRDVIMLRGLVAAGYDINIGTPKTPLDTEFEQSDPHDKNKVVVSLDREMHDILINSGKLRGLENPVLSTFVVFAINEGKMKEMLAKGAHISQSFGKILGDRRKMEEWLEIYPVDEDTKSNLRAVLNKNFKTFEKDGVAAAKRLSSESDGKTDESPTEDSLDESNNTDRAVGAPSSYGTTQFLKIKVSGKNSATPAATPFSSPVVTPSEIETNPDPRALRRMEATDDDHESPTSHNTPSISGSPSAIAAIKRKSGTHLSKTSGKGQGPDGCCNIM